jgi:hypothetical protein
MTLFQLVSSAILLAVLMAVLFQLFAAPHNPSPSLTPQNSHHPTNKSFKLYFTTVI